MRDNKEDEAKRKKIGVASYIAKECSDGGGGDMFLNENEINPNDCDQRIDSEKNKMYCDFSIINLESANTEHRDVMLYMPNSAPPDSKVFFDKKLDTSAKLYLNKEKIKNKHVEYQHLYKSWSEKRYVIIVAYCLMDTALTDELDSKFRCSSNNIAEACVFGVPQRMLMGHTTKLKTQALMGQLMYPDNVVFNDSCMDYSYKYMFYEPGYEYNDEHFKYLPCRAGRTCSNVKGVYTYLSCFSDFKGQYNAIMRGENYCTTTMVDDKTIKKNNWIKGKDYHVINVKNVRPHVFHNCVNKEACKERMNSTKDLYEKQILMKKCKYDTEYIEISYDVKFVYPNIRKGLNAIICERMTQQRAFFQKKKAEAKKVNNQFDADRYDSQQLSAKKAGNSCFGVALNIDKRVGGAITQCARDQNESTSEIYKNLLGPITNGDTDSVSTADKALFVDNPYDESEILLAAHYKLFGENAGIKTFHEILEKLFIKYEEFNNKHLNDIKWKAPAFLEVEKIAVFSFLSKRKITCWSNMKREVNSLSKSLGYLQKRLIELDAKLYVSYSLLL